MFWGYNGAAKQSFGSALIHMSLLKSPEFVIPITDVAISYLSGEAVREEMDCVIDFQEGRSLKSTFAPLYGVQHERANFDLGRKGA
jgi:hypothetical protein